MVDVLYSEPDGSTVLDSFLQHTIDVEFEVPKERKEESECRKKRTKSTLSKCKDTRSFFKLIPAKRRRTDHLHLQQLSFREIDMIISHCTYFEHGICTYRPYRIKIYEE